MLSETQRQETRQSADYLKALADPTRLQIVRVLRQGTLTVGEIATMLESDVQLVSHHLRVLYHAGITVNRRSGKYVYYSLSPGLVANRRNGTALNLGCCRLDVIT